jgi:hypothetical protein
MAKKMMYEEFREFLQFQAKEIEKYKWCLGEQLQHDPLDDRPFYEIAQEWMNKFAKICRKEWEDTH